VRITQTGQTVQSSSSVVGSPGSPPVYGRCELPPPLYLRPPLFFADLRPALRPPLFLVDLRAVVLRPPAIAFLRVPDFRVVAFLRVPVAFLRVADFLIAPAFFAPLFFLVTAFFALLFFFVTLFFAALFFVPVAFRAPDFLAPPDRLTATNHPQSAGALETRRPWYSSKHKRRGLPRKAGSEIRRSRRWPLPSVSSRTAAPQNAERTRGGGAVAGEPRQAGDRDHPRAIPLRWAA
jgi:hypothetical protein